MKETIKWNKVSVMPPCSGTYLVASLVNYGDEDIMEFDLLEYDDEIKLWHVPEIKLCCSLEYKAWAKLEGPKV